MSASYFPKRSEIKRQWHLIDASDIVLGRLSCEVATLLMGKHKPTFTPSQDTGDHVVVVNAAKIHLTGRKLDQKTYYSYSGYPGGLKEVVAKDLQAETPEKLIYAAVRGMLPKTKLGRAMFKKLRVYSGAEHQQAAQQPQPRALAHTSPRSGD
jgi:large subunit ribosomal protein L13